MYSIPKFEYFLTLFNFSLICSIFLCVGGLFLYNFWYTLGGYTTIENLDKDRKAFYYRNGQVEAVENPYDYGFFSNIKLTLGENVFCWFLFQNPKGDGIKF